MNDFFKILFRSEVKALSGPSFKNVLALVGILLFTILALGLAYGTLDNLKTRMDNPYTNWVDVPITNSVSPKVSTILNYFEDKQHLEEYNLARVTRYSLFYAQFLHVNQKDTFYLKGRTVEPRERILQSVFKDIKGNVLAEYSTLEGMPCGIVVTKDFLTILGYEGKELEVRKIYMPYEGHSVLIDIVAVVKELPSLCSFLSTPVLENMRNLPNYKTGFINEDQTNVALVLLDDRLTEIERDEWKKSCSNLGVTEISESGKVLVSKNGTETLYKFLFPMDSVPDNAALNIVLSKTPTGNKASLFFETYCNDRFSEVESPDHFAFQFKSLDQVRKFKDGMMEDFDVTVSMQQIESAENFSIVATLTFTTSLVLFGFAMLSMGFYTSSLIRSHILKIGPNLGTMKAFGLNNRVLILVYMGIIGMFCLSASVAAMLISLLIQNILSPWLGGIYMDVLNFKVILALLFILLLCIFLTYRSTRMILGHTPGDLIYKRKEG